MAEGQEQNRTESATPFKLKKAREKGMVARGLDLGFVASLIGLAAYIIVAGAELISVLGVAMRRALTTGIVGAAEPAVAMALAAGSLWPVLHPVTLLGGTLIAVILAVEIVQLRGLIFSATPLKPDFSRLNPAKGLKRILSAQMLRQAAKSIFKMAIYTTVATFAIRAALAEAGTRVTDAPRLADAMNHAAMRLVLLFILGAGGLAVIDQVLARGEFAKQMRMSRREVSREHKEREGDPRLKSKRKQTHAQFAKQAQALGNLPGSDMLIVNPHHYAVALSYASDAGSAPVVTAKGADRHALQLKAVAARHHIPVIEQRALARALYRDTEMGRQISPQHYHAVAELYFRLGVAARD